MFWARKLNKNSTILIIFQDWPVFIDIIRTVSVRAFLLWCWTDAYLLKKVFDIRPNRAKKTVRAIRPNRANNDGMAIHPNKAPTKYSGE